VQGFIRGVRKESVLFDLGGNRITLDKILVKDQRVALVSLVDGGTAYN
jgi:hypothetical protein